MPSRILRDWTDSEPVNSLSADAERFFVRLIMKVDDYGRLFASPKLLRPLLYPLLLEQVREASVERLIAECVKARLVRLYESGGRQYLEVANFGQRTRTASKYPDSCLTDDGHMADICPSNVSRPPPYAEAHAKAHPMSPGGGRRGVSDYSPAFMRLWDAAPGTARDRSNRAESYKFWREYKLEPRAEEIMRALGAWKQSDQWSKEGGKFVPALHRWLKNRKYEELPSSVAVDADEPREPTDEELERAYGGGGKGEAA